MVKAKTPATRKTRAERLESGEVTNQELTSGFGVQILQRTRSTLAIPEVESRLSVTIQTDFIDRWEGLSTTESVFDESPNARFLSSALSDQTVRGNVAKFFVSRGIAAVLEAMIPVVMLKPGETAYTKHQVIGAVTDRVGSTHEGMIIA